MMKKDTYCSSPGFILRNRDYQEADRLISIFTREYGKIGAVAKGVKKPKSSLRACTQPFCYAELYLRRGKNLHTVTQGQIIDFFAASRNDLTGVMYLLYIAEILDRVLPEHQPYPELFSKTIQIVRQIEEKGAQPIWLRYFEAQFVAQLGFAPVLDRCVSCDEKHETGQYFSISEGGLLCKSCYQHTTEAIFFMSAEMLSVLKLLQKDQALILLERLRISEATLNQLENFWEKYLEYHLEQRFRIKEAFSAWKKFSR